MVDHDIKNLFNEIYDSTNRKVLKFITAKCSNTSDIKDIFQDTYMELYAVLAKRGSNYVKNREAFVMKIAKEKVFSYYSLFNKLKLLVPIISSNDNEDEEMIADSQTEDFDVELKASDEVLISQISRFLSGKPQDIQKIFYLYYSMDMTIPEIADHLSMNESNIKNKLYRTLAQLRKFYCEKDDMML